VSALPRAGTAPGSTVVLEKPLGEDLDEAIELNRLLSSLHPEQAIFRVDHVLAMNTVQNILGTKRWRWRAEPATTTASERSRTCCRTISCSSCVWSRWSRRSASASTIRDRKVDVLRSIHALSPEEAVNCTAGTLERRPNRRTSCPLPMPKSTESRRNTRRPSPKSTNELDNARWAGTTFRTGKALQPTRSTMASRGDRIAEDNAPWDVCLFRQQTAVVHKRKFATVAQIQQKRL
jgi:glucose-6-phosphate 1-dehydrogenase